MPAQTPTAPPISRQPSGLANEDVSVGDNIEESKTMTTNLGLWTGRSPRGSSYGSRISSLVHSHRYIIWFFIFFFSSVQKYKTFIKLFLNVFLVAFSADQWK